MIAAASILSSSTDRRLPTCADIDALYDKQVLAQFSFVSLRGSASNAYQAGSPVAMRLSMSRKAFSIASLWYISYMS